MVIVCIFSGWLSPVALSRTTVCTNYESLFIVIMTTEDVPCIVIMIMKRRKNNKKSEGKRGKLTKTDKKAKTI